LPRLTPLVLGLSLCAFLGLPLATPASDRGATEPAVAPEPHDPPPAVPTASTIGRRTIPVVTIRRGAVDARLLTLYVSEADGRPLQGAELYRQLGRPDLVSAFREREVRRGVLAGVGGAIALAGVIYAATGPVPTVDQPADQFRRSADQVGERVMAGVGISLVGTGIMLAGALVDPDPLSEAERGELVDRYNSSLQSGAGGAVEPAPAPASTGPALSFRAALLPGGAVAGLALAF